jgi:hypothetical protein
MWGFDEYEVKSRMSELPALNGLLSWEIAHSRYAEGADMVLHLVNPSRPAPGGFCWNCLGANRAMVRSLETSRTEMVLFAGAAGQLPRGRAGHWAAADRLPAWVALNTLALLIASSARLNEAHATVRRELLPLIARHLDAAHSHNGRRGGKFVG